MAKSACEPWDNGVNLFDNAETYGNPGEAERVMGEALRQLSDKQPNGDG